MKHALITGITGQDGSYLAELLLGKGYTVYGMIRRSSTIPTFRLEHIYQDSNTEDKNYNLRLIYGDVTDASSVNRIIQNNHFDEIYHLAAQSHVGISFDNPEYTTQSIYIGTLNMLEAIREAGVRPKFYQASSSEMFGKVMRCPQSEDTEFNPVSPYAVAKCAAHQLARIYRDAYGIPISCGILFNHESPRRGHNFVTYKVCKAAVRIKLGLQDKLYLGNLEARRDWGYAPEFVEMMWKMLQHEPDDFVIATGEHYTVEELLDESFGLLGLDWHDKVVVTTKYMRPLDVDFLMGDSSKAKKILGWEPKTKFKELVRLMVEMEAKKACLSI